jgi:hypothetical protein
VFVSCEAKPSLDHVIRQIRASGGRQPADTQTAAGPDAPRSPDLAQTGPQVEGAAIAGASAGLSSSSLGSGPDATDRCITITENLRFLRKFHEIMLTAVHIGLRAKTALGDRQEIISPSR